MSLSRFLRLTTRAASAVRHSIGHPHVVRPAVVSATSHLPHWSACYDANRSFAAEAGFPDRADVKARVLEVVKKFEKVQPEKVRESSHFVNDLGLDSLDTVELVMALEDEFAIEIPDADAEQILTCTDAVEYLANNIHVK